MDRLKRKLFSALFAIVLPVHTKKTFLQVEKRRSEASLLTKDQPKNTSTIASAETGNVSLITLMVIISTCLLLALCTSAACAYVAWSCVSHSLEVSVETIMGTSFQMELKSSEKPGILIADKIAQNMRDAQYQSRLQIWFEESDSEQLKDNVRAMAVYAVLDEDFGTSTLLGKIPLVCSSSASLVPYSDTKVFKPKQQHAVEVYNYDKGSRIAQASIVTSNNAPEGLKQALNNALTIAMNY